MATTAPTSIRIDPELRRQAESVFDQLGLTPSAAITLFYKAVVRENGLPFELTLSPIEPKVDADSVLVERLVGLLAERGWATRAEEHGKVEG
ncbi:type II toxin-antitoxin system RelB/DinJ family antitoxin [Bifidobacterium miconisargentati]|uniref:type II toxin-antitoxin system RelB/DinJ family antitoxin n=1 Tax=Bifidobacterium miconisargentati TaxID=2834437 RepID=UPI001BDBC4D3|nr:type II toxin-antitoxin system RelB/DinJ family antitoxin [Bifidobacterium miconisargentati]MBW3089223.1 type II toxin-antitoxin system RelB/DinJ family antitoxin [Bifidobacterium miconisargentati]